MLYRLKSDPSVEVEWVVLWRSSPGCKDSYTGLCCGERFEMPAELFNRLFEPIPKPAKSGWKFRVPTVPVQPVLVEEELEAAYNKGRGAAVDLHILDRAAAELRRLRKPRKFRLQIPMGENIVQVVDAEEVLES